MNRRFFLSLLGIAPVAAIVPGAPGAPWATLGVDGGGAGNVMAICTEPARMITIVARTEGYDASLAALERAAIDKAART